MDSLATKLQYDLDFWEERGNNAWGLQKYPRISRLLVAENLGIVKIS